MSGQKPKGLNILLVLVFILTFIAVKAFNEPDHFAGTDQSGLTNPISIDIAKVSQLVRGYMIVPFDEYTGQAAATPFETVYNDYDHCLVALFEKRQYLARVKTQYSMSVKCELPSA